MRSAALVGLLAISPGLAWAQSSQFGVRGLGLPVRPLATHAIGSAGAFGLFDPESSLNPAALGAATVLTSVFTASEAFRSVDNPAGSASTRDVRFPQLMIFGPVRQTGAALGFSYSGYTDRDFTIASSGTIDLRGAPVGVVDSFSSRGGLSDLRAAGAYRVHDRWTFGAGFHVITGSNRLESRQTFTDPDSSYLPSVQRTEISYAGIGVSAGLIRQMGTRFAVAALARWDGHLNVDRDSVRVSTIDLPYTFGLGFRWQPMPKLGLATHGIVRTWSAANSDLLVQGGFGAENTFEVALGGEYTPDLKRPFQRPLRFGARYGLLPFPLVPGTRPHEFGLSAGSGMRFAQDRGGIDFALEHVWRSESAHSERGIIVTLGISVRP
jgi:hypothetical protein